MPPAYGYSIAGFFAVLWFYDRNYQFIYLIIYEFPATHPVE